MAQLFISQVPEEIEGRVTKKLSKDFRRTDSRILDSLSKLDEFLLNPQFRTYSVYAPGISGNNDSENREPIGDRSLGDPCPEAVFSTYHSSNLNDSEQEETNHSWLPLKMFHITKNLWKLLFQIGKKLKTSDGALHCRIVFHLYFVASANSITSETQCTKILEELGMTLGLIPEMESDVILEMLFRSLA